MAFTVYFYYTKRRSSPIYDNRVYRTLEKETNGETLGVRAETVDEEICYSIPPLIRKETATTIHFENKSFSTSSASDRYL